MVGKKVGEKFPGKKVSEKWSLGKKYQEKSTNWNILNNTYYT